MEQTKIQRLFNPLLLLEPDREEKFALSPYIILGLIVISGIILRIIFFTGLTFSDDGYYNQLGYMMLKGENPENIMGYPIFIIRKLDILFTAVSFSLFGTNVTASVLPGFIFSIGNLILIYFIARELSLKKSTALMSSFLLCFFPVDIFFASVHNTDLTVSFFINSGIYFLLKSYRTMKISQAVYGGLFLTLSLFIKESVLFILVLIFIIWVYNLAFKGKNIMQIPVALLIFAAGILLESIYYFNTQGDFFYRFTMQHRNYIYCVYDFFPYTKDLNSITLWEYIKKLAKYIFSENPRYIFFRRYYLFTPLIGALQSYILYKERRNIKLLIWFVGILILAIGFTTSFSAWRPVEMKKSWYVYIYLEPVILMTAMFVVSLKRNYRIAAIALYVTGSILMVNAYSTFFGMNENNALKKVILENSSKVIYTDHHNKYNLDVVLSYKDTSQVRIFTGINFNFDKIMPGEWVLIKDKTIYELKLQGYKFADMSFLKTNRFNLIYNDGVEQIYEKRLSVLP